MIVLGHQSTSKKFFDLFPVIQPMCLFFFILLVILLMIVVSVGMIRFSHLQMQFNQTIKQLNEKIERYHAQPDRSSNRNLLTNIVAAEFTEGTTCGCARWCQKRASPYGICGDGHTCICRESPIEKASVGMLFHRMFRTENSSRSIPGDGCTCDQWCRKHGHQKGGICGDGYTCICSK